MPPPHSGDRGASPRGSTIPFRARCRVGSEAGRNPVVPGTRGFDSSRAHQLNPLLRCARRSKELDHGRQILVPRRAPGA